LLAIFLTFLIVYFIKQNKEHYALLLPVALCGLYWYIFRVDLLFLFLAFSVPLSTSLEMLGFHNALGVELFLPSEAVLIALLAFASYKLLFYFDVFKPLLSHPIFIGISIYLFTIFFTSITSEMPIVSFKFFLSRLWLMLPPLILGYLFFKQTNLNYHKFILLLSTSAALVVLYTISRFVLEGMELHAAHFVMQPFYKDHTVYGASITLIAFLSVFNIFNAKLNFITRLYVLMLSLILIAGIMFSFTRAAWLSIICALVVYAIMKLRISFRFLFISTATVLLVLVSFWTEIYFALNKNSQDSSANFSEHVSSVSNISTDASNLERLNRWFCAIELWEERPVVGWGPGTYQFQYSAHQKSYTRSLIS
ncbi:MAG: O-antigen ligase family protein, partial [Flavobacteriales bacterium]